MKAGYVRLSVAAYGNVCLARSNQIKKVLSESILCTLHINDALILIKINTECSLKISEQNLSNFKLNFIKSTTKIRSPQPYVIST